MQDFLWQDLRQDICLFMQDFWQDLQHSSKVLVQDILQMQDLWQDLFRLCRIMQDFLQDFLQDLQNSRKLGNCLCRKIF